MSKEETITMKEHIEILSQQQDYQFAEGFKQGIKEEQLNILKMIDEYKYNKNGSFDIKKKGSYKRISFALFLKELKQRLEQK